MRKKLEPYKKFLGKDPRLENWLKSEIVIPKTKNNITLALVGSILSQQLSTKVAEVMFQRFLALFKTRQPKASDILNVPIPKIKAIGISQKKAEYIHHVAEFMVAQKVTISKISKMSDDEIIDFFCQIKGIGRWTVEMLLIFALKREDVFAVDDLGIQKAMVEIFQLQALSKKDLREKMIEYSRRWSPYRTYVCLHFWKYSGFRE